MHKKYIIGIFYFSKKRNSVFCLFWFIFRFSQQKQHESGLLKILALSFNSYFLLRLPELPVSSFSSWADLKGWEAMRHNVNCELEEFLAHRWSSINTAFMVTKEVVIIGFLESCKISFHVSKNTQEWVFLGLIKVDFTGGLTMVCLEALSKNKCVASQEVSGGNPMDTGFLRLYCWKGCEGG